MERNRIRLNKNQSKLSINEDSYGYINLDNTSKLLPYNDILKVINENEQFNKERNSCTRYRVVSSINPLFSNVLFNITGENSWSTFNKPIFRDRSFPPNGVSINDDEDFTYAESVGHHLKEKNGWFGYYDPKLNSNNRFLFNYMKPGKEELGLITKNGLENWDVTFTYPAEKLHNELTESGLDIVGKVSVNVGGKSMTALAIPYKHNLKMGDFVKLTNIDADGVYEVMRIGLDNGDLKGNYFVIDLPETSVTLNEGKMTKIVKGEPVEYYFRVFKRVHTVNGEEFSNKDYDAYPLAFSKNVFGDDMVQITTKNDIDVDGLEDNLGRPLSEFFLTYIKKDNKDFSKVSSGLLLNNVPGIENRKDIPDIRRIHNGGDGHTALNDNVDFSDDTFIGDLVEYNKTTLNETILAKTHHRFNTINRELGGQLKTNLGKDDGIVVDVKPEDIWDGLNPDYQPIEDKPAIFLFAAFGPDRFIDDGLDDGNEGGGGGYSGGGFTNKGIFLSYDKNEEICGVNNVTAQYFMGSSNFQYTTTLYADSDGYIKAASGYYSDGKVTRYWDRDLTRFTSFKTCEVDYSNPDNGDEYDSENTGPVSLGERHEGYLYDPFHRIKIREFSDYIEVGDANVFNMPTYASKKGENRFIWRDLLDIGVNSSEGGVDYPFLNGSHNLYVDSVLALKRQDPFNDYGLWSNGELKDIGGNRINDKDKINKAGDVC
jgi:hypothetical protein